MNRIAVFEKVSFEQFAQSWQSCFGETDTDTVRRIYDRIQLPQRATAGSAGYDFFSPETFEIAPGEQILIPTGIRVRMREDYVLVLFPRSGLGFRYRLQLNNTAGIIDSDYYGAENEGHILCKLTNDTKEGKTVKLEAGKGFVQGIFLTYGITEDDAAKAQRTGGFGSTTDRKAG